MNGPPRKALEYINKLRSKHAAEPSAKQDVDAKAQELRHAMENKDKPVSKVARGSRQVEANKIADDLREMRSRPQKMEPYVSKIEHKEYKPMEKMELKEMKPRKKK